MGCWRGRVISLSYIPEFWPTETGQQNAVPRHLHQWPQVRQLMLPTKYIPEVWRVCILKLDTHAETEWWVCCMIGFIGLKCPVMWMKGLRDFYEYEVWCICRKTPANKCTPLVSVVTIQPLELVCVDLLMLKTFIGGFHFQHVLIIIDHFTTYSYTCNTNYSEQNLCQDHSWCDLQQHCHISHRMPKQPTQITSGANFQSQIIKEQCQVRIHVNASTGHICICLGHCSHTRNLTGNGRATL